MIEDSIMIAATEKVLTIVCISCKESAVKEIDISDIIGSPSEDMLIRDVILTYLNDLISDANRLRDGTGVDLDTHPALTIQETLTIGAMLDELVDRGIILETEPGPAIFAYVHKAILEHARDRVNSGDYNYV